MNATKHKAGKTKVVGGNTQEKQCTAKTEAPLLLLRKETLPDGHLKIGDVLNILDTVYSKLTRHKEALPLWEESLALYKRVLPTDHPKNASCMCNLAYTYLHLEMYDKAEQLGKQSLIFLREIAPEDHVRIGRTTVVLTIIYDSIGGRHSETLSLLNQLLTLYKRVLPRGNPRIDEVTNRIVKLQSQLPEGVPQVGCD